MRALEDLGFSWHSPSEVDVDSCDWDDMCARFAAYRKEHGDGQVRTPSPAKSFFPILLLLFLSLFPFIHIFLLFFFIFFFSDKIITS